MLRLHHAPCTMHHAPCTMPFNGQPSRFALNLERDLGEGSVARLEAQRQTVTKEFPSEEKLAYYRAAVAEL